MRTPKPSKASQAVHKPGASELLGQKCITTSSDQTVQTGPDALALPRYFVVLDGKTIIDPDAEREDEVWADLFPLHYSEQDSPFQVIQTVSSCELLAEHFAEQVANERVSLVVACDIAESDGDIERFHRLNELIDLIDQESNNAWAEWVRLEGQVDIHPFIALIDNWQRAPVDHSKFEHFPLDYGVQGQAYAYFESLDAEILKKLRVRIVEGDCPGSSYFAAELRQPLDEANHVAETLRLPFRFKAGGW